MLRAHVSKQQRSRKPMKNPLKTIQEKAKTVLAKLKPSPEGKVKILNRTGLVLLGGAAVAFGVLVLGPATVAVAAGSTCLGLMGVGAGLVQEADNAKHQIWMKAHPEAFTLPVRKKKTRPAPENKVEAPAPEAAPVAAEKKVETPAPAAPVVETAPAVIEKKADVTPVQPAAEFTVVAEKKPEAPAPAVAPVAAPEAKPEAPKP
jgi:hypothetical protein